jgi:hypothetical protein
MPRHRCLLPLIAILVAPAVHAVSPEEQEVAQELAAVLAWRLGPEAVVEWCEAPDPAGHDARTQAVKAWREKNAALIQSADQRVAEVVPLVYRAAPGEDAVQAVRRQVKELLFESLLQGRTADETRAICHQEADTANPRWTGQRIREVQQSLAALYDWKVRLENKK